MPYTAYGHAYGGVTVTVCIAAGSRVIGADFQNADPGIGLVYHNDSLVLSD